MPKKIYYFTQHNFDKFDDSKSDNKVALLGPGHYFTSDPNNKDIQQHTKAKYVHSADFTPNHRKKLANIFEPLSNDFIENMKTYAETLEDPEERRHILKAHNLLSNLQQHHDTVLKTPKERQPHYPTHADIYGAEMHVIRPPGSEFDVEKWQYPTKNFFKRW